MKAQISADRMPLNFHNLFDQNVNLYQGMTEYNIICFGRQGKTTDIVFLKIPKTHTHTHTCTESSFM